MKRLTFFLIGLLFVSCQEEKEKEPLLGEYTIEQFYDNESVNGGSFSPDGKYLLVNSNESGIYNVYEINIESGERRQLTNSTEDSYFGTSYLPDGKGFIYQADQGGNENNRLYLKRPSGETLLLTPGDSVKNGFWGWSRDEERMYLSSNARDSRYMDIYTMEVTEMTGEEPSKKMIYKNEDGLDVGAISDDERYFALTQALTSADGKMYLYDAKTGQKTDISEHEGDATYSPQFFSRDNKYLYYTTDEGSDFVYLAKRDLESGEVLKEFGTNWDVWYAYESWNGKYRVIGINEDGRTVVRIFNLKTGEEVQLPEIEGGSITSVGISKDENMARLTVGSSASPSNIYVYNFETGDLKKVTNTLNPDINPDDLVEGQVVRYKSFDGLEIPAIYYQPKQASTDKPVPGLVWVHGGPGGQSRLNYFALIQYLVNHGYAILAVNNRGSGGYGKEFNHMDDKNHGDADLKDCIAGKDFFASTGVIDMDKVGIIGGSYGGYMVMAALTFTPEEFDVGVNIFGVTNWIRTLRSIPPYWESYRKALYDELGDPNTQDSVRLREISPLFHASKVQKPLMVLQGANDVRVLQVESDEIVEAVRQNGVPVEYLVFEDEGHGFIKKENQINAYGQIKVFLDRHLKGIEDAKTNEETIATEAGAVSMNP